MKKVFVLLLALACASVAFGQSAAPRKKVTYDVTDEKDANAKRVAVYVTGGKDAGANEVLGAQLVDAITKSQQFVAIERTADFLRQLSTEQSYQRSGSVDDNQISRLGKQAGVSYVCVAEMTPVQGGDFVTARLIDVETASVVAVADGGEQISSLSMLMSASTSIAEQLLKNAVANKSGKSKERVAVYIAGIDEGNTNKVLGAKLVSSITKSHKYVAMERTDAFLKQLNEEHNYERSGSVDDNQIASLGKQFGVQYVCVAKVIETYGEKFLSSRLINVETAGVIATANDALTHSNLNSLITITQNVAQKLLSSAGSVDFEYEMADVNGGTFTMGCDPYGYHKKDCKDNEKPAHSVTVSGFKIGKYEVTQAQWKAVMGIIDPSTNEIIGDDLPVEAFWDDMQTFLQQLNSKTGKHYRLPTEAEWEFVASRGSSNANCYWSKYNSDGHIHPVGTKWPNSWDIYDMIGNVPEWCSDIYSSSYYSSSPTHNPTGPSSGSSSHVIRGGAFNSDEIDCTRVSARDYGDIAGFRLVLPLDE
jgi:formylglycine-generating enzyme required for sulfatase activity